MNVVTLFSILCLFTLSLYAEGLPPNYEVFEQTRSPDSRWVIAGIKAGAVEQPSKNYLVDSASGDIFTTLKGTAGRPNQNHMDIEARWTSDSRSLLWIVHSKWGPASVIFLDIQDETNPIQVDLRKAAVTAILGRLKEAYPEEYQSTVESMEGGNDYYIDGFTFDLRFVRQDLRVPVEFYVGATSSPKRLPILTDGIRGFLIDGFLKGTLEKDHTVSWGTFFKAKHAGTMEDEIGIPDPIESLRQLERDAADRLSDQEGERFLEKSAKWNLELTKRSSHLGMTFSGQAFWIHESEAISARRRNLEKILNQR